MMNLQKDKWRTSKLGDVCVFEYGGSLRDKERNGGKFPVYGSAGIVGWHDKALTESATLIIGRKGSVGNVFYSEIPCFPIDTTYFIEETKTKENLQWLLYFLINYDLRRLNMATAVPGLNRNVAYQIEIPLPPLDEQQRIVELFQSVEQGFPRGAWERANRLIQHGEKMLSPNALAILTRRYLKKDENGNPTETPEDMFRRVADNIASAELLYDPEADVKTIADDFYRVMSNLYFLPNSPTLMNAGRDLQQLSACFVLPIEDSMEGIFETLKQVALIHKSGGGTGMSFSRLRPKNDRVQTTHGVSSGPVSFMKIFDAATEHVKQGGVRRGANMGVLRVDHPDILEFIHCKDSGNESLRNFNISVAITDAFMCAVESGKEYDLINPRTGEAVGSLNALEVFNQLAEKAWATGDPGLIFIDTVNVNNPTPWLGTIESTNPCGEVAVLPYESCNLGSINLAKMVWETAIDGVIDYQLLEQTIRIAIRFLDNVIDLNHYPLPQIEELTKANRKIGLGVMGFADMLIMLGISYNSEKAIEMADEVMQFISQKSFEESVALAERRGAFPNLKQSSFSRKKIRNAARTAIAPTGTISMIAGCSSGIEPLFAVAYTKVVMDGTHLYEVNPLFEKTAKENGFYSEELIKKVAESGTLKDCPEVPEDIKKLFVTAHEIAPEWHVKMQAAFQKHTDLGVSKTINFPKDAVKEDIKKAYLLAYQEGCKGITVFRDGCKSEQVLYSGKKEDKKLEIPLHITPRKRQAVTKGETQKIAVGCGNLYITLNKDEAGICEVFSAMGKTGGCAAAQSEAVSRLVSLAFRSGVEPQEVISQLAGIRCPNPSWQKNEMVLSCPDAMAKAIKRFANGNGTEIKPLKQDMAGICPDCGHVLMFAEGCVVCRECGFSKCG